MVNGLCVLGADEIATRLRVSRDTIRTHLAMLREKLGLRSALAVAAAMRRAVKPVRPGKPLDIRRARAKAGSAQRGGTPWIPPMPPT
ncbi:MAG TPA: LuxR C-terminal-related transcriptional regulator [Allosphingosinicella sp.]|nr:LuxR C-terminal-related transcriptional regulator [Allosphingosinicella sp.]